MIFVTVHMFILSMVLSLCLADLYNLPASTELEMYRHRTKIAYNRLKADGCSAPPAVLLRRDLVSDRTATQLEMEIEFYNELTDLLIACRKAKLSTISTTTKLPTNTAQQPTTTMLSTSSERKLGGG